MNDPAARLAAVRQAVPVGLDGAVLVESWSNDTWVTDGSVLRVCWRGDRGRLLREQALLASLPVAVAVAVGVIALGACVASGNDPLDGERRVDRDNEVVHAFDAGVGIVLLFPVHDVAVGVGVADGADRVRRRQHPGRQRAGGLRGQRGRRRLRRRRALLMLQLSRREILLRTGPGRAGPAWGTSQAGPSFGSNGCAGC